MYHHVLCMTHVRLGIATREDLQQLGLYTKFWFRCLDTTSKRHRDEYSVHADNNFSGAVFASKTYSSGHNSSFRQWSSQRNSSLHQLPDTGLHCRKTPHTKRVSNSRGRSRPEMGDWPDSGIGKPSENPATATKVSKKPKLMRRASGVA